MSARAATRLFGLLSATAFTVMAASGTALAEEPCQATEVCAPSLPTGMRHCIVDIGYCETTARCVVNVGYCENGGMCTVNVGHCAAGDEGAIAIDGEVPLRSG